MAEIGEELTLQIIVKEAGRGEGGWNVTAEIPLFKSEYPTKLTRVPENLASQMVVGTAYRVVLKRGNLKKGKDGKNIYWDYYWDWVRPATKEEQLTPTAASVAPAPAPAPPPLVAEKAAPPQVDSRGQSIERQSALKSAIELHRGTVDAVTAGPVLDVDAVLDTATRFAKWLATPQEAQ